MRSAWQGLTGWIFPLTPQPAKAVFEQKTDGQGVRYRRPENIVVESVGEGLILLDLELGTAFQLNSTGKRVWEFAGKGQNVGEIVQELSRTFSVTREQLEQDVTAVIRQLLQNHLLEPLAGEDQ